VIEPESFFLAHGQDVLILFMGIVGGANLVALSSVLMGWFAWRSKRYSRGAFMLGIVALATGVWLGWLLEWNFQKDFWTGAVLGLFPLSLTGIMLSFWKRDCG
jgi:hypothetical protein